MPYFALIIMFYHVKIACYQFFMHFQTSFQSASQLVIQVINVLIIIKQAKIASLDEKLHK